MTWEETREKQKQLLIKWHELRKEIEPLEKVCMGKEIGLAGEIEPTPLEIFNKWYDLVKQEEAIFDEMAEIMREYHKEKTTNQF